MDGGNTSHRDTSHRDEWADPEQRVTAMQMQDWQGRETVRSQQMDGDAQSSSRTSARLPHTALSAGHSSSGHLQGAAARPQHLSALDPAQGKGAGSA